MSSLAFIAGAALVLASPDMANLVRYQDYPTGPLTRNLSAAAVIDLMIDPAGRTVKCQNLTTYGDAGLSADICKIVSRKRVRPATFRDGTGAYFIVDTLVKFCIPDTPVGAQICAMSQQPDLELTVNHLPGHGRAADVRLVLAVDEHGTVTDCGADKLEKQAVLVNTVCQDRSLLRREARTDLDGHPIAYVTTMKVRLVIGEAQNVPTTSN